MSAVQPAGIDLNCDMGELPELLADGTQEELLRWVSSVNVACGAHAGDPELIAETVLAATRHGVHVGAHPGYPDRANFGRVALAMLPGALSDSIAEQVRLLAAIAADCGVRLTHGKPHGALYNTAAASDEIARAVAGGVARAGLAVPLMGLAGSRMLQVFAAGGHEVWPEAFADRRYEADGSLRSRTHPDAVIRDPEAAARQAVSIARDGVVQAVDGTLVPVSACTLCIHSDSPGASRIAAAVHGALTAAGIPIRPPVA